MHSKFIRSAIITASVFLAFATFSAQVSLAQIDNGGGGQGQGGDGIPNATNQVQNTGTTANLQGSDGTADPTVDNVDIDIAEDTRNQGFIGATSANITGSDTGFVGAASETSGPALSADASFGGDFNSAAPVVNTGGGGAGGGGIAGATGNVSNIARRSIRAKLVPSFYSPRPTDQSVSNRFQSRFARQPGSNVVGNGYSVRVENRTAFVSGFVNTRADSDRIERQLRLEPGVYKIVNRLSLGSQSRVQPGRQQQRIQPAQQPVVQPIIQQQISAPVPIYNQPRFTPNPTNGSR